MFAEFASYSFEKWMVFTILLTFVILPTLTIIIKYNSVINAIAKYLIFRPEKIDHLRYKTLIESDRFIPETINTPDGMTLDAGFYNSYRKPCYETDTIYLYSHGNYGWLGLVLDTNNVKFLSTYGSVFTYDYRGYGKSSGSPSDDGLFIDARSVWDYLVNVKNIPTNRIHIFGHSLGTSVTANLMHHLLESEKRTPPVMILQNGFSSMNNLLHEIVPYLGKLVDTKFNTVSFIKNIDKMTDSVKIVFIHSEEDELINCRHSVELHAIVENNNCKLLIVPGKHEGPDHDDAVHAHFKDLHGIGM